MADEARGLDRLPEPHLVGQDAVQAMGPRKLPVPGRCSDASPFSSDFRTWKRHVIRGSFLKLSEEHLMHAK